MAKRPFEKVTENMLAEARLARESFDFGVARYLGVVTNATIGDYLMNYAVMIKNRMLSLYDDCIFLLDNDKVPSACIVARCMIETFAVGEFANHEVVRAFNNGGIAKASSTILKFINSSRIKVEEQDKLKKGLFTLDNYSFTNEARTRLEDELASSVHILNAVRHICRQELQATGKKISSIELMYSSLCEWTHPSQTSLFHAFVPEVHEIPTSAGTVNLFDSARLGCANAMHFLTAVPDLMANISLVARDLDAAATKK